MISSRFYYTGDICGCLFENTYLSSGKQYPRIMLVVKVVEDKGDVIVVVDGVLCEGEYGEVDEGEGYFGFEFVAVRI